MITVESSKALVLDRKMGRIATAAQPGSIFSVLHEDDPPSRPKALRVLRSAHSHVLSLPSASMYVNLFRVIHLASDGERVVLPINRGAEVMEMCRAQNSQSFRP